MARTATAATLMLAMMGCVTPVDPDSDGLAWNDGKADVETPSPLWAPPEDIRLRVRVAVLELARFDAAGELIPYDERALGDYVAPDVQVRLDFSAAIGDPKEAELQEYDPEEWTDDVYRVQDLHGVHPAKASDLLEPFRIRIIDHDSFSTTDIATCTATVPPEAIRDGVHVIRSCDDDPHFRRLTLAWTF